MWLCVCVWVQLIINASGVCLCRNQVRCRGLSALPSSSQRQPPRCVAMCVWLLVHMCVFHMPPNCDPAFCIKRGCQPEAHNDTSRTQVAKRLSELGGKKLYKPRHTPSSLICVHAPHLFVLPFETEFCKRLWVWLSWQRSSRTVWQLVCVHWKRVVDGYKPHTQIGCFNEKREVYYVSIERVQIERGRER